VLRAHAAACSGAKRRIYGDRCISRRMHEHELQFIRGALHRNQLTGSEAFILEIEERTGERILHWPRGSRGSTTKPVAGKIDLSPLFL
jgi:hypothetical protein